ncbi:Tfx family DNA-binding protein [Methanorbis rubei]|uniref:Tfx family DNA-binding protein n=1 Tax=Methanorbis rubei TaxID=3028300 RepID=UPI0030B89F62
MKEAILTERQKTVLQCRKMGMTQQQIADMLNTNKSNISLIEKSALKNVRMAKDVLEFVYSMDAAHICVLARGTNINRAPQILYEAVQPLGIKIQYDIGALVTHIRTAVPEKLRENEVRTDIHIYLNDTGILYIG